MPVRPLLLGLKSAITVGSLAASDYLKATCPQCRAKARIAPWTLHDRFPASTKIAHLESRMVCKRCGHRGVQDWQVWRASSPVALVSANPARHLLRNDLNLDVYHPLGPSPTEGPATE